jgi:hypothetical protein
MLNLWALQTLLQLLLTPFVTCTPVETQQTLQHRDSAEGIVSGIEWRDESGTGGSLLPRQEDLTGLRERSSAS